MSDDARWWWFLSMFPMIVGAFSVGACAGHDTTTAWFEKRGCKVDVVRGAP